VAGGFDVVIDGMPAPAVLGWMTDTFGAEHVVRGADFVRLVLRDQAALVGALRQLHDLGVEIALVARRSPCGSAAARRRSGPR
jgi:hypothetical protein